MIKFIKIVEGYKLVNPESIDVSQGFKAVNGVETVNIFTVPTGKIFFLSLVWLSSRESADASAQCYIGIYDPADVLKNIVAHHYYDKAGHQIQVNPYPLPFHISEGWDIKIVSTHANVDGMGGYSGELEDKLV
jgi:hypothetical protein